MQESSLSGGLMSNFMRIDTYKHICACLLLATFVQTYLPNNSVDLPTYLSNLSKAHLSIDLSIYLSVYLAL